MDEYDSHVWENALYDARMYHLKKRSNRYNYGVDYDENGEIYDGFPEVVKRAIEYLCENGEID